MIGVEEDRLDEALDILQKYAGRRKEKVYQSRPHAPRGDVLRPPVPMEVMAGGAAVFILDSGGHPQVLSMPEEPGAYAPRLRLSRHGACRRRMACRRGTGGPRGPWTRGDPAWYAAGQPLRWNFARSRSICFW